MTLLINSPSLMMTIQDQGRFGYQRYGLPESGPVDWWAFQAANALVGNEMDCACLEIGFSSAVCTVEVDALMALCGVGYRLRVNHSELPLWMAFRVREGDVLTIEKIPGGNWSYLAVSGGILSSEWLGSRSVYPRAGLGRGLMGGDRLPLSSRVDDSVGLAGNVVSSEARPPYHHDLELRVVLGPHQDRFEESCIEKMADGVYRLSHQSDRMGYRLNGRKLKHKNGADILSQGMVMGEIQVPADGLPIVMMPDHPTTGGYTCIGTIARADLPLLAQAQPEESEISFKPVSILEAQQALKEVAAKLDAAIQTEEEPWLDY